MLSAAPTAQPAPSTARARYRVKVIGDLFAVRWYGDMHLDDLEAVVEQVCALGAERPVHYVGFSEDTQGSPDGADYVRQVVQAGLRVARATVSYHVVLPGRTLTAQLGRSFYRSLILGARMTNEVLGNDAAGLAHRVRVHDSLPAFMVDFGDQAGLSPEAVSAALRADGFLDRLIHS